MELGPHIRQVSEVVWEIDPSYKEGMKVPARIYATDVLIRDMDQQVVDQITNVATLPGLIRYAYCMPDGHSGYGFPIGGVAAMDVDHGVISPGGIGFDINCGMRLVRTNLTVDEVQPKLKVLVDLLYQRVPAGVGSSGFVKLTSQEFKKVIAQGGRWCIQNGYGWPEDLESTEEEGCIEGADPEKISKKAIERGLNQIGTLGSGNHYLEVQVVKKENIFDHKIAGAFGLFPDQVVVMFHCGSRGFGHQVATDYLQVFLKVMTSKYGITILDRELACAPFRSPEGRDYFSAMKCGLNMSFANRQTILHRIRECFEKVFNQGAEQMDMHMIYDVAHNTAKLERYPIDGREREVLVHRKGATRAFGPGHPALPERFRTHGQPVIIGGSMETGSYLLVGTSGAMTETFGSTAHGAGRTMSRTQARKRFRGEQLQKELMARGIYVRSVSYAGLAEEAGPSYKNIDDVIHAVERAGISKKVVKLLPIGNIKG
jgi:tRNA-splicing ligase RtcB